MSTLRQIHVEPCGGNKLAPRTKLSTTLKCTLTWCEQTSRGGGPGRVDGSLREETVLARYVHSGAKRDFWAMGKLGMKVTREANAWIQEEELEKSLAFGDLVPKYYIHLVMLVQGHKFSVLVADRMDETVREAWDRLHEHAFSVTGAAEHVEIIVAHVATKFHKNPRGALQMSYFFD